MPLHPLSGFNRSHTLTTGFTLIELAVVIAIIAILAAVAIPRFGNALGSSECAKIKDLAARLSSSASIYTAEQGQSPAGFTDFVTQTPTVTAPHTLSLNQFECGSIGATITQCTSFRYYDPTYAWNNGQISLVKPVPKRQADAADCL